MAARQNLIDRYGERIAGVLSCYDRVAITGTIAVICDAEGMTRLPYAKDYSLIDLREIVLGCNRRHLVHISALDDFSAGVRALDRLTKPHGRTVGCLSSGWRADPHALQFRLAIDKLVFQRAQDVQGH